MPTPNSLAVREENAVAAALDYNNAQLIKTLKETVCKGATDAQFFMFVEVARATGLNPLLKEIWYVPNVGVMAGRDGYLRVANEHPQFDGMETTVERDDNGIPIKATCKVWRKDRNHPITCEAYYNEYKKPSQVWQTYKSAMISKVAEVLALKRSFSINGIVTEEEIGQIESPSQVAERRISELKVEPVAPIDAPTIVDAEPPKPAKTTDFEMLKHFKAMKAELGEQAYREVLAQFGYQKSNQIADRDAARKVYVAMGKRRAAMKEHEDVVDTLKQAGAVLGVDRLINVLGVLGAESAEDVMGMTEEQRVNVLMAVNAAVKEKTGK